MTLKTAKKVIQCNFDVNHIYAHTVARLADTRPIKTTLLGMIIEGLTTNKGRINVGYY